MSYFRNSLYIAVRRTPYKTVPYTNAHKLEVYIVNVVLLQLRLKYYYAPYPSPKLLITEDLSFPHYVP